MRKTGWRIAQALLGIVVLVFLTVHILDAWHKVEEQPIQWELHWEFIIASLIVTWAMYGVLIWGWRTVLEGWRESLRIVDAARIWTISSLGQYIPFKVWSITGMAVMAQQRGVSGAAAAGSAVVMQLISLATGAVVGLALVGTTVFDRYVDGWGSLIAIILATLALVAAIGLTSPSVTRRIGFLIGRPDAVRPVDPGALAAAIVANLVAWGGYGIALQLIALGTLHGVELSWATATGAFASSYVLGYVAFLLPAGIGVREGAIIALLVGTHTTDVGPAAALAAASRVTLTINQVGAALPFLLFRSKPRVNS